MSKQNKTKKMVDEKSTKEKPKVKKEVKPYHDKETLVRMYEKEGKSAGEIARMFNVSRAAVLFQMRKHNIPITTRKTAAKDADKRYRDKNWLSKHLKSGKSIFQIAKDCKVSYSSVRLPAIKFGLGTEIEQGRKVRKAKKQRPKTAKESTK